MLNRYNFIDGIECVEAICVCLGASLHCGLSGHLDVVRVALLLAIAAAGFLLWDGPPAQMLMGCGEMVYGAHCIHACQVAACHSGSLFLSPLR
ncbi:hypothetical protein GPJ81_07520 [Pseudomonas alkylphenolica]|uniref:Uncharacterized protein n=1 Tax=Pseudomonas alkylphenolica TaxID=237609 RepID=A0A6I6HAT2_9PSED|nr:hypothetical protein GPJ81_07520 [Pseudomonas alkylphenolica]